MRRLVVVILALGFLVTFSGLSAAAPQKKQAQAITSGLSVQQRRALEARSLEVFDQQPWTIYLTADNAKKGAQAQQDVLTFTGKSVISQYLTGRGFGGSNFSLSVQDDGTGVFETVQRDKNDDIAAWRGELRGTSLSGILSIQYKKGGGESYSFSSGAPSAVAAPAVSVSEQPAKKK